MTRIIFATLFLGFLFNLHFAFAQNASVELNIYVDSSANYNHVLEILISNKTNKDIYLPYTDGEAHIIFSSNSKEANLSWCLYNERMCNDTVKQQRLENYSYFRGKADSILVGNDLSKFAGTNSFYFLKRGEELKYKIPLCYLKDKKGTFYFQYNNTMLGRCTEHMYVNQRAYNSKRRFHLLGRSETKLPEYISTYKLTYKVLKSEKIKLEL